MVSRKVLGLSTCLIIIFSGFFGAIFMYGPLLSLMFIYPKLYRRSVEIVASMWQTLLVTVNGKFIFLSFKFFSSLNKVSIEKKVV